jgi:hypothetical protein
MQLMTVIGKVDSLWRYPVKSMRGEQRDAAFLGFSGVYGDRLFAFTSSKAQKGFPFLTCREQHEMLRYYPRFRQPDVAARPVNLAETEKLAPGATPVYGEPAEMMVDVETPSGEVLAIDDPRLRQLLVDGMQNPPDLKLVRSDRAQTDCRPLSLFSMQTVHQLGHEFGAPMDPRRFRANVYVDLSSDNGFGEEEYLARSSHTAPGC